MARVCGPILGFRGLAGEALQLAVMVAHDADTAPGALTFAARGQTPAAGTSLSPLGRVGETVFFGCAFAVPIAGEERLIEYGFEGEDRRWTFAVPGAAQPLRIAYASCNGFSLPGEMKKIADKNALWRDLMAQNARQGFHLLLMGGDQIYADQLWDAVGELKGFNDLPRDERVRRVPSASLRDDLERFYAATYQDRLSEEATADALASIPSLMMWDDHDLFDGWGSYSDEEQASPVFQTIFAAARSCFMLFQLQTDPRSSAWPALPGQPSFNALLRLGDVGLLVLDLRSERLQSQVISPSTWNTILAALDSADGLRHLLVMSSIPIVHPDLSFVEHALALVPGQVGEGGNEDDLHDQWTSYNHRTERLRLIHRLLDYADAKGTRVTIVSGDVHVAALGVVVSARRSVRWSNSNVINQLTSSPIVHPTPPGIVRYFLEQLGRGVNQLDRDITAEMLEFPATNARIVNARNWLSLEFDDQGRIWANWHVEGTSHMLTKVVHPCEAVAVARS